MNSKPLNDDVDIGELDALVGEILSSTASTDRGEGKMRQPADARRELEQYLEDKWLREQMQDPYC
jgi:hypothetical protein